MNGQNGIVVRAYRTAYPEALKVGEGTVVTVEERETEWPGWLWAATADGVAGWVPDRLLVRNGAQGMLTADYDGTELTVESGAALTVLEEHGGWYRCEGEGGARGWIPAGHVELEAAPVVTSSHPHPIPQRRDVREALLHSEEAYRTLVDKSLQGLFISQGLPPKVVFANRTFQSIIGYSFDDLQAMSFEQMAELVHPEDREIAFGHYQTRLSGQVAPERLEYRALHRDGRVIWVEEYVTHIRLGGEPAIMASVVDVTDRKRAEQEREQLIENLMRALHEVKTLQGIIPICGHCKKVRDDQGYWKQVEQYLHEQAGTEVSHGLCPDCVKELYPDYYERTSEER